MSANNKEMLRLKMFERMKQISLEEYGVAGQQLKEQFSMIVQMEERFAEPERKLVVAGYLPIKNEINPQPLIEAFVLPNHTLVLPKVRGGGDPLHFHQWIYGETLMSGLVSGVDEPLNYTPELLPDVILIPMVGFSRKGYRLGHGGGYFDRTLPLLRETKNVVCVGLAYSFQEIEDFPSESHDIKMDYIVTDKEVLAFG